ncbi:hypothetical protein F442_00663 [Phytophthora nicotianae P10297]|uniref:Uncharacterized protein n=1 Tax=Phytophthora nicotianae P10297 TaxID=1317064 RepID=W3A500_PHYNI|nr:hypothetical protein F442_00663 [Phytophthora nicotianae P10297]
MKMLVVADVDKALVRAKVRHDGPGVGMLGNGCVGGSADPKFVQSVVAWDCRAAVQGFIGRGGVSGDGLRGEGRFF